MAYSEKQESRYKFITLHIEIKTTILAAHISIMMPCEYNKVDRKRLKKVAKKWKNQNIAFEISGCSVWWHEDPTGVKMWLLGFNIISKDIQRLRRDLGLIENYEYTPHRIILECVVSE